MSGKHRAAMELLLVVLVLPLTLSGCATVAEMALQSVVEEIVDGDGPSTSDPWRPSEGPDKPTVDLGPDNVRPGGGEASVYVVGPVSGWQRGPGIFGSGSNSPYYRASLFRGYCPALINIRLPQERDPFGPVANAPLGVFDVAGNLGSSPDYTRFGRVELGGLGTPQHAWYPLTLFSNAGDRCGLAGIRLLSFGEERVEILHR